MTSPASLSAKSAVRDIGRATGLRVLSGHAVVPMPLLNTVIKNALADVSVIRSLDLTARSGFADLAIVLELLGNPLALDAQLAIARARVNTQEAQLVLSLLAPPSVGVNGMPISSQFVRVLDVLGHAALQTVSTDAFADLINHDQAPNGRLLKIDFDRFTSVAGALNHRLGGVPVRDLFSIDRGAVTEAGLLLRFRIHWGALFRALFGLVVQAFANKK